MSNSSQRSGKAPESASFVNLLSQYLKEKRNLGNISIGMTSKPEAKGLETSRQQAMTMNFLPNLDNSSESSRPNVVASTSNVKSSDFFPDIHSFGAFFFKEDTAKTDFRKQALVEPKNAQLTIFFGGQVLVYNDFPADKVKEIMDLASQGCSAACGGIVADSGMEKVISYIDGGHSSNSDIPDLNITSTTANSSVQDSSVERRQFGGSDLRIARRNSLHKFFEKRKDRAAARAPYQVNNRLGSSPPPKPDESKFSHEEGQSPKEASRDLDLNL
ncbi:protein TIFY 11B-like [Durio zibethinus]|uniref:Protein TIFY n=1 Tax=Durio zibethinus TaxID=66656 RepID=A0A6P5X6Z2_DURZI|nr:protein TIFY 11B-like [Durio zibethinus]